MRQKRIDNLGLNKAQVRRPGFGSPYETWKLERFVHCHYQVNTDVEILGRSEVRGNHPESPFLRRSLLNVLAIENTLPALSFSRLQRVLHPWPDSAPTPVVKS